MTGETGLNCGRRKKSGRAKVTQRSHHDIAYEHPLKPMPLTTINFLQLTLSSSPDKISKVKVTTTKSKVQSRLSHFPHHSLPDIAPTMFLRSQSLQQGQKANQGHITILHMCIPQPISPIGLKIFYYLPCVVYDLYMGIYRAGYIFFCKQWHPLTMDN